MFDHLEPKVTKSLSMHHHFPLAILMVACCMVIAAFSSPIISHTQTTSPVGTFEVRLWSHSSAVTQQTVVGPIDNLTLGHWVIQTPNKMSLHRLRVSFDGLYNPADISTLRFYLDDVQVGRDRSLLPDGSVVFDLSTVDLSPGTHDIVVRANWLASRPGQLISSRLQSEKDLGFTSTAGTPTLVAIFPVPGNETSFVSHGSWLVSQLTDNKPIAADGDHNIQQMIFTIPLIAQSEALTLNRIDAAFLSQKFLVQSVSLKVNGEIIKNWKVNRSGDDIVWKASSSDVVISPDQSQSIQFIILGQAENELAHVQLHITRVEGSGYRSGSVISWEAIGGLTSDRYIVHDQPSWKLVQAAKEGNFALQLDTLSKKDITISSLVMQLNAGKNFPVSRWKAYVRGSTVPAAFSYANPNLVRVRFKPSITLSPGDNIEFEATANVDADRIGDIRLLSDEFIWSTSNQQWWSVNNANLPTAPAGRIAY